MSFAVTRDVDFPCHEKSDLFFVSSHRSRLPEDAQSRADSEEKEREAKAICSECPLQVKTACLIEDYRYSGHGSVRVYGIRAGLNERERRSLYRTFRRKPEVLSPSS